jgi:hypothetical protein
VATVVLAAAALQIKVAVLDRQDHRQADKVHQAALVLQIARLTAQTAEAEEQDHPVYQDTEDQALIIRSLQQSVDRQLAGLPAVVDTFQEVSEEVEQERVCLESLTQVEEEAQLLTDRLQ